MKLMVSSLSEFDADVQYVDAFHEDPKGVTRLVLTRDLVARGRKSVITSVYFAAWGDSDTAPRPDEVAGWMTERGLARRVPTPRELKDPHGVTVSRGV